MVQWLRLCAPNAGGTGSIPGRRTKIPHAAAVWPKKRMGLFASGTNDVISGLEPSVPPQQLLGRGEGLEIEFNHQWPKI